jgi:hypothetical protein
VTRIVYPTFESAEETPGSIWVNVFFVAAFVFAGAGAAYQALLETRVVRTDPERWSKQDKVANLLLAVHKVNQQLRRPLGCLSHLAKYFDLELEEVSKRGRKVRGRDGPATSRPSPATARGRAPHGPRNTPLTRLSGPPARAGAAERRHAAAGAPRDAHHDRGARDRAAHLRRHLDQPARRGQIAAAACEKASAACSTWPDRPAAPRAAAAAPPAQAPPQRLQRLPFRTPDHTQHGSALDLHSCS